jgi:hypothetical protein
MGALCYVRQMFFLLWYYLLLPPVNANSNAPPSLMVLICIPTMEDLVLVWTISSIVFVQLAHHWPAKVRPSPCSQLGLEASILPYHFEINPVVVLTSGLSAL